MEGRNVARVFVMVFQIVSCVCSNHFFVFTWGLREWKESP